MDERFIEAVSTVAGCSYEDAEKFLNSETGCYADIGNNSCWMSGDFIRRILEAVQEY